MEPAHVLTKVADGLPGFGIVVQVLGIVITMGSIGGDIKEVGAHVAGALVGTFLGASCSAYGFIGLVAAAVEARAEQDSRIYESVKTALLACLRGYNPEDRAGVRAQDRAVGTAPGLHRVRSYT